MQCSICGRPIPAGLALCPDCATVPRRDETADLATPEAAWEYWDVPIALGPSGDPASAPVTERAARLVRDALDGLLQDGWQPAGLTHATASPASPVGDPLGAAIIRIRRERRRALPDAPEDSPSDPSPIPPAILQFQPGPGGTGVAREGPLRPGGPLRIAYDPARMLASHAHSAAGLPEGEILAHVRFHPSGQLHSGRVAVPGAPNHRARELPPEPFEVTIPADTRQMEIWFEYRGMEGTRRWDSRYGRNYWFDVDPHGAPPLGDAVVARLGAVTDPEMVSVFASTAVKRREHVAASGSRVEVRLSVGVWVRNVVYQKGVWIDVHVLDGEGHVLHAATLPLRYLEGFGPTGDLFGWEDSLYRGTGGGSGQGVHPRPDADQIQFRLYYQAGERVYTDGLLYQLDLPTDASVRQVASSATGGPLVLRDGDVLPPPAPGRRPHDILEGDDRRRAHADDVQARTGLGGGAR